MQPYRELLSDMHTLNRNTAFQRSLRRRAMWLLFVPVVLAIIAFGTAIGISSQQVSSGAFTGSLKATGIASFGYLILVFLYAPAYLAGLVWFYYGTSAPGADVRRRLLVMPVISACFAWCPVMFVAALPMADRIVGFVALIPTVLIAGLAWSCFVRWAVTLNLKSRPAAA
jgi:hypothetical protein